MLDEERMQIIQNAIKNDEDCGAGMEESFSLEEMLFYMRSLQMVGGRVAKETVEKMAKLARKHRPWHVLMVSDGAVPYVENGRGYLFTDPGMGMQAKKVYASMGYDLALTKTDVYDELPFDMFARYGVDVVSINKGTFGIALKTAVFTKNSQNENVRLNNSMLKFVLATKLGLDEEIKRLDNAVSDAIMESELYFVPENGTNSPMQEIIDFTDGASAIGGYLFSDRQEAARIYLNRISQLKKAPAGKIFGADPLIAKYILNPGSINLLVSQGLVDSVINK